MPSASHPPLTRIFLTLAATWLVACGLVVLAGGAHAKESPAEAAEGPPRYENIHVIDFDGDIEALMLAYVTRRVETAQKDGADCIVLRIYSPGGYVHHSKKIGDLLLRLPENIHTVAWVPLEAISGAAFISLSCREIIMTQEASLGDSQPILPGEGGKPEPVGEKAESPLRTWFRGYAEKNGYPIALAEAMVSAHLEVLRVRAKTDGTLHYVRGEDFRKAADEAVLLPGLTKADLVQDGPPVVRKGELFTMTGRQAVEFGFMKRSFGGADGLPTSEEQVLEALKAPGARVTFTQMSASEKASKWLLQVAGILSAIVALSILLFIWNGPGLMTIVGGVALVIVILITITAEQLNGFPLFLILLGIALLIAEVFLIPGFGIPGFLGVVSLAAGLLFLATGSTPDDTGGLEEGVLLDFGLQFVFTAIVGFAVLMVMSRFFPRVGPAKRMILAPSGAPAMTAETAAGPDAPPIGAIGRAATGLRPAGTAEFDGALVDVVSDGEFINADAPVRVVAVEGDRVTVTEATGAEADA